MLQQRTRGFNISAPESLKVIGQNFDTLSQLQGATIDGSHYPNHLSIDQMNGFQFDTRRLKIGQWVDVKDTIEQWVIPG